MFAYEVSAKGLVISEPMRGYRALTSGMPGPWSSDSDMIAPREPTGFPGKNLSSARPSNTSEKGNEMKSAGKPMTEQQLRETNEALLLVSSVHQHELTEQAQKAEAALRESEERYRTLVDLGPVAIYSCVTSGVIDHFNRRAEELWGRAPAQGDSIERFCGSLKLFRPDGTLTPHDQCPMAEVLSGKIEEVNDGEMLLERPDGSRVAVIVNIRPLRNQRGEVTGAINCFYDITERKRADAALRDSQSRFEALFDASPVGMYLVDSELRIRLVSRTARPAFGDIGELIGRDFVEVIHILWPPESADEIVARFRHTLATGEPHVAFEFSEVRYDRKVRECYDWQIIDMRDALRVVCMRLSASSPA